MIIKIKDLKVKAIIGFESWERKKKQTVVINIEYELKKTKAHITDNINDTINYRTLAKEIIRFTKSSKYLLIESLAYNILKIIKKDKRVKWAKVEVDKPGALRDSRSVGVEISS